MFNAFERVAGEARDGEDVPLGDPGEIVFNFDRAFTLAEVAEKLGLSHRQVQAHVDDGNLIAVHVGRGKERKNLRILDEDLEGFVRRRKTGVSSAVHPPTTPSRKPRAPAAAEVSTPYSYAARRAARRASREI